MKTQPTEEGAGPAVLAPAVRPSGVLDLTGDSQGAGFPVLAQQRISTRKGPGHLQLHHALVAGQILEGTKIAAVGVGTPHVLATVTPRHELFPQTFLAQTAGKPFFPKPNKQPIEKKKPNVSVPDQIPSRPLCRHGTHGWRQPRTRRPPPTVAARRPPRAAPAGGTHEQHPRVELTSSTPAPPPMMTSEPSCTCECRSEAATADAAH